MSSAILEVKNLHKSFQTHFWSEPVAVLKGVEFSIVPGSVTGFLGSNGSGKTTTFKCILDLIKKDHGEVFFSGAPLSLQSKSYIGFLPERIQVYEDLTAEEYLLFLGQLNDSKIDLKSRIYKLLKQMDLYTVKNHKLKTFSKGMIQKIGLIQALIPAPKLVLLDEPFTGLDSEIRFYTLEMIENMQKEGLTFFISSHILPDVERICDHLVVLREGLVIFEGDYLSQPMLQQKHHILYMLNDQKHSVWVLNQKQCQKEIKDILSKGGYILSVSPAHSQLEQMYKQWMLHK